MQNVRIKSTYGYISANVAGPTGPITKAVTVMPGFLDTKDYFHLLEIQRFLLESGYLAISFDPTGIWDSEGGNERHSISQHLIDLERVIDWIKNNFSEVKEISIGGYSLGGFVAMLYSIKNPHQISKVFTIMSPPHFPGSNLMKSKVVKWKALGIKHSTRIAAHDGSDVEFHLPYAFVEDSLQYQNPRYSEIKIPKLFIAGQEDEHNTPKMIKEIYDSSVEPKQYDVIKGAIHDYRTQPSKVMAINKLVLEFLNKEY